MKVKFIGTGGAFASIERGQSNMLFISDSGKKMLLDCGGSAPYKLAELDINALDIDALYVSHLHSDHCGGIEWFGFSHYFIPGSKEKPKLFCERGLMSDLWNQTLRGGMKCIQGIDCDLGTFFDRQPIDMSQGGSFKWQDYTFRLVQTMHVAGGFEINPSYGLMVWKNGHEEHKTFFTTDTQFTHPCQLQVMYDMADTVYHDCETGIGFKSGVHAHYDDMNQFLNKETKKKLFLYHYGEKRNTWKKDGFGGFVDTFDEFEL